MVLLTLVFVYQYSWDWNYFWAGVSGTLFYMFFSEINLVYHTWHGVSFRQEAKKTWTVWLGVVAGLLLLAYATKSSGLFSRRVILTWFTITPFFLLLARFGKRFLDMAVREQRKTINKAAILGAGDRGKRFAKILLNSQWIQVEIVGFYDQIKTDGTIPFSEFSIKIEGGIEELVRDARSHRFHDLYIALPPRAEKQIKELINRLSDTGVSIYLVPDFFISSFLPFRLINLGGMPVINIIENPFNGINKILKWTEDILLGILFLLVSAFPMVLIALAIKCTSPGPVLYKQRRFGLQGEEIIIWKFRTMVQCEDDPDFKQAQRNDPRITPLGALLRRTSLDELPQLFNVFQGKMSLVGPRPHPIPLEKHHRKIVEGYLLRQKVKPGITGLAQVNGWRGETDTQEKMERRIDHDLEYIHNWTLGLDLKIIFLTILKGWRGEDTY